MTGSVVTFYSYKGGVGRSFLVANAAVLLARWGYRVLCVDWDIEAPGLDEYFRPWLGARERPGLVELVTQFATGGKVDWRAHVSELRLPGADAPLHLITAGAPGPELSTRVQAIDWRELYDHRGFGAFLETLRDAWKADYDLVLVDSRTGITDIGGICTVHLPDVLVTVFTANQQSLGGVKGVVQLAEARRSKLPLARAGLVTLPVLARFDARGQDDLAKQWLRRVADELAGLYEGWLDDDVSPRQFLEATRIPYFSVWTFGERLAVLEERDSDPEYISYHVATIAALLARGFDEPGALCRSRDTYVELARAQRQVVARGIELSEFDHDYYVSYRSDHVDLAVQVAIALRARGRSAFVDAEEVPRGRGGRATLENAVERCRHFVMLRSANTRRTSWQLNELTAFVEASGTDESRLIYDVQLDPIHVLQQAIPAVSSMSPQRVRKISATHRAADRIADAILPGSAASTSDTPIDDYLRERAELYVDVQNVDTRERVQIKDALVEEMCAHVRANQISRDELARSEHDGLVVALAEAVRIAPQAGDLDRLIQAGLGVTRLHAAFRVLTAIHIAIERERVQDAQRVALEAVIEAYMGLAMRRGDEPLATLVATTMRLLKNLA
ncbi:MAG TPA: TIR domain-containing protein [Kofleriaceae bacterium]|nr:TIR domain-containing protein [Kofleriaceae bacterium]